MMLETDLIMTLKVDIGAHQIVGDTVKGHLKVIPITGGSFEGPGMKGRVIPGGADWNSLIGGKLRHVFAKYTIETDDGELISIENEGYGEDTEPKPFIRTVPRFTVREGSPYDYLRSGVFVGSLKKGDGEFVEIQIFKLR
ncbi:DUF3237 domain-containing protein [Acidaminobacter hydrogenoformans]|uniref:UPF0311 protein SAMN03080599_02061 n=1 Tax=Acidaminobacter hydrogenoformans DSM 2784 TaxID=1120920 RepID=A0A1G5S162_9FIRM|nr:DUF3237 domain-containing protein [Acidaminobacter hydrogenoformans]SCZ80026.1 Protein of unknown function [Acidaminobacter hydrogenoformans DSM 2784]